MASTATSTALGTDLDERAINTIRFLAVDAVQRAESGHPGTPMALAPAAYVLWTRHLKHNPRDPRWPDRDRFVLSNGHASMLLYGLLHLTGYDLPMEQIKNFRQWDSLTPGHPENFLTPGVETTTGPLGQGFANGIGMAIAERYLAAHFNEDGFPIVDHHTYAFCSDGDVMEGISHEAASLAGHLGLSKLVYIYDDNHITIDGDTALTFTEDTGARFASYGWHVQHVDDGNDLDAIDRAIQAAKDETERPSFIVMRTEIGYGSPNKQDTAEAHGAPLGEDEVRLTKENLGWPVDKTFYVPDDVRTHLREAVDEGRARQAEWDDLMVRYKENYPEKAARFTDWREGNLPDGWDADLPAFETGEKLATRKASNAVIEKIFPKLDFMIGGSADLHASNKTLVEERGVFQKDTPKGANFYFGVREHGMAGISNGITTHGGLRAYCATFFIFSDYLRPSMRLSALMSAPVIYVYTHDSIGLGEDGPTHQPIEHLMSVRAIPGLTLIRPADATETVEAWKAAIRSDTPVGLVFTRQGVPTLDRSVYASAEGLQKGAYILSDADGPPDVILIGTGSEVQHAVQAAETLREEGRAVRVVSMPSWELFEQQDQRYRDEVLPPAVTKRVSIEAGVTLGWERYVGDEGIAIGVDRFGASAPGATNMEKFGFTAENVVDTVRAMME